MEEILYFFKELTYMESVHQCMMGLHIQGHQQAITIIEELSPCKPGHRIGGVEMHRVHELGKRHPGYGSHVQKVILSWFRLERAESCCVLAICIFALASKVEKSSI